jgi:hypothetical protein
MGFAFLLLVVVIRRVFAVVASEAKQSSFREAIEKAGLLRRKCSSQ